MNNEYLRLDCEERFVDSSVNEYSVKTPVKKAVEKNTALKLILDEIYSKCNSVNISETAKKPKLLDAIVFSSILLLFALLLSVVTYYSRVFTMLELTVCCYSAIMPTSIIYLIYKLDVTGKVKFSTIIYCVFVGVAVFVLVEIIFSKLISQALRDYHAYVAVMCLIEMLSVVGVAYLIMCSMNKLSNTTLLIISCAVAVGFSLSNALADNFYLLLTNVTQLGAGEAVGVIIYDEEYVKFSMNNLISSFSTVSIYRPFVFIALTVIIFRSLTKSFSKKGKKVVNVLFTILFCLVTYILSSLKTPFDILTVLYNLIAIIFTVYLFITAINDCIKSEKYE